MDLLDRIHRVAKELGMDGSIVDLGELILNDRHTSLDEAYLFTNTQDNEQSLFRAAQQMRLDGLAEKFLIIDGAEAHGFPGYNAWHERLGIMVGSDNVRHVPLPNRYQVNTLTESQALAAYAREHNKQFLYIVAAHFHQLRAVMTAASEAVRHERLGNNQLNLFSYVGASLPWDETVFHSQGTLRATRAELIRHEMERIQTYQTKGDILPTADIITYLDGRRAPPQRHGQ